MNILVVLGGLLALVVYLLPTIIAFGRKHHYKWVICGINGVFGFTGIGYLAAFVWAVWPEQTALFDVVANDLTTNSPEAGQKIYGQMGTNVRAFSEASNGRSPVPSPQMATAPQTRAPSHPDSTSPAHNVSTFADRTPTLGGMLKIVFIGVIATVVVMIATFAWVFYKLDRRSPDLNVSSTQGTKPSDAHPVGDRSSPNVGVLSTEAAPQPSDAPSPATAIAEKPEAQMRERTSVGEQEQTRSSDSLEASIGHDVEMSKKANADGLTLLKASNPDFQAAKRTFEEAVRSDSSNAEALNNLGYVYQRLGDFRTSEAYISKAIQLAPDRRVAYGNLGYVQAKLGESSEASHSFCEYVNRFNDLDQGKATLKRVMSDPDVNVQSAVNDTIAQCSAR